MNIILVVFDSWRKDCTGVYGAPPWGKVHTPNFDRFAEESLVMTRAFPESLPTLPARRALYTGRRVYPFHNGDFRLKGDFIGAPGWGPIPEDQETLSELLSPMGASDYWWRDSTPVPNATYRTCLIADVPHMFKPSKNYWRGFDQWMFLRGQESDRARSGPRLTPEEMDYWLPNVVKNAPGVGQAHEYFLQRYIPTMRDRTREEDYFTPRIMQEASRWLEQNYDADKFFLTMELFDPHEPWLVPEKYRKMYLEEDGEEQVLSLYGDVGIFSPELMARTQANYSGLVTMCDHWFGVFMDTLKAQGRLDDTMVILTSDHGHSIGERDYMGKSGYPSAPEVYDIPLMIRFPGAEHGGTSSDQFVQHHDITALILEAAGVAPPAEMEGISFLQSAVAGKAGERDHVTVGWGSTPTVITDRWWLNCKADGSGVLLHDLKKVEPFAENEASENPEVVKELFAMATADAAGGFPDWIIELAKSKKDAPGCSDMAARR